MSITGTEEIRTIKTLAILYLDLIAKKENFSFSRFGDGEFAAVFQEPGMNCDGHEYFSDMGEELKKILDTKKDYFVGLQPLADGLYGSKIDFPQEWVYADELHDLSKDGNIRQLRKVLDLRNVVFVGSNEEIAKKLNARFVEVPKVNAWLEHERILKAIKPKKDDVVLFSCGMLANWLIDKLHSKDYTLIDAGSLFDPYVGVSSRTYHRGVHSFWWDYIHVNMATFPERRRAFESALSSILDANVKPDFINVCLNNYKVNLRMEGVNFFIPKEDQGARGKFVHLGAEGYYFSVDDDIMYPRNYVGYLRHQIEVFERKAIVGIHGTTYPKGKIQSYWHSPSKRFHFASEVRKAEEVTMLGTGTMAFHSDTVKLKPEDLPEKNMLDPRMSILLREKGIPQMVLVRAKDYLTQIPRSQEGECIWKKALENDTIQTKIMNHEG